MIGEAFSHYTILEKLGGGSMGVIYKAQPLHVGLDEALRVRSAADNPPPWSVTTGQGD